jgi:UDP-N-acetylmuramoyl-tripeptide--D-alanyl-D-alanine ligase
MNALWTAPALCAATGGAMAVPFAAHGISIDTRTLQPGDLFVALQAETDGHAHATQALARGAAGVLVQRLDGLPEGAPALLVDDTLLALQALGRAGRARFGGRMVAVTGSVGKTTTKEMLRRALSVMGPTHAAQASYNNHWGVPITLALLPADAAFCVCEIGMNNAGETLPLARMVRPHVAVITTIAAAHIGRLGSLEAIADEKASLLDALEPGGVAVLPADSAFLGRMRARHAGATLTFGQAAASDLRMTDALVQPEGTTLVAVAGGGEIRCALSAPGAHMAMNALAALAACVALGFDAGRAAAALDGFAPVAGRGQQRRIRDGGVLLLDESYNANTASMRAALAVLRTMPGTRRVAVLGDMLELGEFGPAEHAGLADDVARAADVLHACGPLSRALFDRIPVAQRGIHAESSAALAGLVAATLRPGDAVLVKGSLGSRMRLVVQAIEHADGPPFAGAGGRPPVETSGTPPVGVA